MLYYASLCYLLLVIRILQQQALPTTNSSTYYSYTKEEHECIQLFKDIYHVDLEAPHMRPLFLEG
jgi:hypothetical protein